MNLSSLIYLENSTIRYPLYLVQDEASRIPCSNLFHGIEPVLGRILGIAAVFIAVEEVHRLGIIAKLERMRKDFPVWRGPKERRNDCSAGLQFVLSWCKSVKRFAVMSSIILPADKPIHTQMMKRTLDIEKERKSYSLLVRCLKDMVLVIVNLS